ncbi:alpha/beta hydrolase [Methylotuvimicrobium alcaliphilum]|uniref:Esterase/lipase/thioesterase family protein n=1 Tax=Methylotuvimicrobium alcaliphilum (strain DSM 19304 / NCIMB 14124 / VKM B-2133 / 20Z) TaxID=1091494 RepID=G4SXF0_META2|nr:alpha/beta hydrolase [Methylotuvimicrobium alcaliphilum]CCE25314.1 Esterase/lipase/thioesterase family protein [Methylotuvimicrobium alcaliphilum 20Z]
MSRSNFWRYFIGASGLVLLALLVEAWQVGGALVAPAYRHIEAENLDFPVVETMLDSESGASIATWYASSDDAKATIILLHPIRANRKAMLGRAKFFLDAGYAVVLIDFQAHGESLGRYITFGHLERHDVRAAVVYARKLNPGHRIGVVAISLGGAAALLASPLDVDALVLESVYTTIADAVDNRIAMRIGPLSHVLTPLLLWQLKPRLGVSPSDLRPIDHIAKSQAPVLIANGDLDRHTRITQARQLFDAANKPKRWVVFKGAAHNDLFEYNAKQYKDEVLAFLDRYLKTRQ